jgi:hypothetical protein
MASTLVQPWSICRDPSHWPARWCCETQRTAQGDYGAVQEFMLAGRKTTLWMSLAAVSRRRDRPCLERTGGRPLDTLAWGLVLVPLVALGNLRGAALRGLRRVVAGQLPEFFLRPGLLVILVAGAALVTGGALSSANAMALHVAAASLAFAFGAWMLWRSTPPLVKVAKPRSDSRNWWRSTFPLAFSSGMAVLNRQASILILGLFVPVADVGVPRRLKLRRRFWIDAVIGRRRAFRRPVRSRRVERLQSSSPPAPG